MDGWTDRRHGWLGEWMNGWTDGWMAGWMDGLMDGLIGGWVDGWIGVTAIHLLNLPLPAIGRREPTSPNRRCASTPGIVQLFPFHLMHPA